MFVWNILSRRLASSPWRIFEVSLKLTKKGSIEILLRSFNTCQARQLLHGAVTWFCTKFEYKTTKSGFWGKVTCSFIQRHLRTLYNSFNSYNFWHFLRVMQKHCWPEVHKLQNRARHYNLAKPWLDTSLERYLRHGHLRDISINFLCDLYGKKLFPIISAPNIFTRSRDVKQWNKTFKNENK